MDIKTKVVYLVDYKYYTDYKLIKIFFECE